MKPNDIETLSFKIIDDEAGPHDFSPEAWQIVRRMIHTSADFEYMQSVKFHPKAIESGIAAIRGGHPIFTDTNMARVGIRKGETSRFGVEVSCLIADKAIGESAKELGITRAKAAVDAALEGIGGGIYVVGNAPTALLRLIEKINAGAPPPALIVGLPVGFVNAAESKAELIEVDVPYISNVGRKGGSNVAASVVNALAIMAAKD
jgi:precorrin-8X/cobalt-precorrin-8 methylmutase